MLEPQKGVGQQRPYHDDFSWEEQYLSLRLLARRLIFAFDLPCWRGQEWDLAEDIAQEAMLRGFERVQKAGRNEAAPVLCLKQMMTTIAHNYCKDLWRHDRRLLPLPDYESTPETRVAVDDTTSPLERAVEQAFRAVFFVQVAQEVASFPLKQREALCTDLANRMSFESEATALQAAFRQAGIDLQDYQHPLPADARERRQHMSLLSYAYKRLAKQANLLQYAS